MTATLFTVGEVLAVMLADESPARATGYRATVAGSEANVATGVVRLGLRAVLATRVGRDSLGDAVVARLRTEGVDAAVVRSDLPTGVLIRGLNGEGAVHLRAGSAATELSTDDIAEAWPAHVDAVFVTGITAVRSGSARDAVIDVVDRARAEGALVVVDPNFRPALGTREDFASALQALRGRIDIAIGDLDELRMLEPDSPDPVAALLAGGCRLVVEKLGASGARGITAGDEIVVPSTARFVADTVGAGDAFAAGLIVGLLEDRGLADTLRLAALTAAPVVETAGDIQGLPTRTEADAAMAPVADGCTTASITPEKAER